MPVELKNNLNGGLDLDTSYFQLRKDAYVGALNITRDAIAANNYDKVITNIVSNRKINYTLPSGRNKVIGAEEDRLRNRVYYMVWNENDNHSILRTDMTSRTTIKLIENLTDTNSVDILGFDEFNKINHIDILHRDEGDLVFFVDDINAPKKFNETHILSGNYGTIEYDFISAAKKPPMTVASAGYGNDPTVNANSLRKKLYKFKYRWVYDDFEKSTWSPESPVPLPINLSGTDVDNDPTKNNFISVQVTTGNKDVIKIEIAFTSSLTQTWADYSLAVSLVKADLSISDNSTYQFNFYNDGVYPNIDQAESVLLFDWFPKIARAQCLANGNTLIYGAITENFNQIPTDQLDVVITVANVSNGGTFVGDPDINFSDGGSGGTNWTFTVVGSVPVGTRYRILMNITGGVGVITMSDYTSIGGDTTIQVGVGLYNSTSPTYQASSGGATFILNTPPFSSVLQIIINPGSGGGSSINSPTTWNYNDKHKLGLVYFDGYGRTNGVVYSTSFDLVTPNISISSGVLQTPVVSASINHTPPDWAVTYIWVRTPSLTYQSFKYYYTCDFQEDADYYYFALENIQYFYDLNNSFIYPVVSFAAGDRIKVMLKGNTSVYGTDVYTHDYEILGIVERTIAGGSPVNDAKFIKVKKPISAPVPVYGVNMLVMLYTPAKKTTTDETVFFEFDSTYEIYESGGIRYHRGLDQDQTVSQPATFTFADGPVYFRQRKMYYSIAIATPASANYQLIDANYSDFFESAVNGNGRPEIIDVNARETYNPVLARFGQSYQQGTNINGMNRFYFENFDEYDRGFGDILKFQIRDRYMVVGQKFKIGLVPVESGIIKTFDQQTQIFISDKLINPIQYYVGEYGCSAPESWTQYNFAIYFCDVIRGVICRLSNDGIIPISILYKVNSWATEHLPTRTGNYKIYGAYEPKSNNYIAALEQTGSDSAYTLSFDEETNTFESFLSYAPEMMCVLGTMLISFKDGELWTHDDSTYNNFYGTQYSSYVTIIFNENSVIKKKYNAVSYQSNQTWESPTNGDIATSFANSQTGLQQISQLKSVDYAEQEGVKYAALLRDANSGTNATIALLEGDYLSGVWVSIKFVCTNTGGLIYFQNPYLNYLISQRNL